MIKKNEGLNKIFIMFSIILVFSFTTVWASTANIKSGQTVDKDKTWTIYFNQEIKFDENINSVIKIVDNNQKEIDITVDLGEDNKSLIVRPSIGSYESSKSYTLIIEKDISSKNNKKLHKEVTMSFNIKNYNKEIVMDKLVALPQEEYNQIEAEKMINRLSKIPYSILEELHRNNIKIILSNTNITGVAEYAYLKGVIPRGWEGTGKTWDDVPGAGGNPVVVRIGHSEPGESHGSINLELHETAHAIDKYVFNDISDSENYKVIWKQEVQKLFGSDPYFLNYSEEYFAETFAMYYLNEEQNKRLHEKAPLTYEFIKDLESKINRVVSASTNYSKISSNCIL